MYKLVSVILSLVLLLSLSACGGGAEAEISLTGELGGKISVSAYDSMGYKAFLEDAARLFEGKYPGVAVEVETFSAMPEIKTDGQGDMVMATTQDDSQDRADYINRVNTALMSGGGADVLAMDVLPFYKYADSGQLENLADYMRADPAFDSADYRANILDAVEYKNGIWFLPTDYTFDYYAYDSTLLAGNAVSGFGTGGSFTAEELFSLAELSFDGSAKAFNRPDYASGPRPDMWSLLLEENYPSFVEIESKTANFDDGSFAALLESVKQYGEQGYIPKGAAGRADAGEMLQGLGEGETGRFFFKLKNVLHLLSLFTRDFGLSMTAMGEGDTMAIGDNDEIAGIAADADGAVPFTYSQAYGINGSSTDKETAWAFIKFLLSEEMQLSTSLPPTALPVLNAAREKKMETMLTGRMAQQGESVSNAQAQAIARCNEAVEKLSDHINAYVIRDTIVDDMIAVEVQYFFEGTKTAAEVAGSLQNKAALYLNE